jgi:hypothetical protein
LSPRHGCGAWTRGRPVSVKPWGRFGPVKIYTNKSGGDFVPPGEHKKSTQKLKQYAILLLIFFIFNQLQAV